MEMRPNGRVASVNTGVPQVLVDGEGREWKTAIVKTPVTGRVAVRGVNIEGDDQANRRVHGGRDKAVYAYGRTDVEWWQDTLGRRLAPGAFGENLTVEGLDVSAAVVGERWKVGTATLEVCQPRIPCAKLGVAMGDPDFPQLFTQAARPGAYLRILEPGALAAGDEVQVIDVPHHGLTVRDVFVAYHGRDRALAERMVGTARLARKWQRWAAERLAG